LGGCCRAASPLGRGGIPPTPPSAMPERIQKEAAPAALLVKSRSQQKSFLFLLEEKIRRAQIKKCEENFFAGWRASASGGGQLPLVEILLKESSDFVQKVPPICDFSVLRKVCLALASHGLGRKHAFSLIFVKKNQIYLLKDTI